MGRPSLSRRGSSHIHQYRQATINHIHQYRQATITPFPFPKGKPTGLIPIRQVWQMPFSLQHSKFSCRLTCGAYFSYSFLVYCSLTPCFTAQNLPFRLMCALNKVWERDVLRHTLFIAKRLNQPLSRMYILCSFEITTNRPCCGSGCPLHYHPAPRVPVLFTVFPVIQSVVLS